MNDLDIDLLAAYIREGATIWWSPDSGIARKVVKVGRGPTPKDPSDEPEPGECGFFSNGEYVALWNCEPEHFVQVTPLFR